MWFLRFVFYRLFWSHNLNCEFGELTCVGSILFMGSFKKKKFNLFSIISFKIWFFFGINLHCLSCFGFYWAILLGQSESRGLVVLPDFDCFFKSFLFVIFFYRFHHSTVDLLGIRFCDFFFICFVLGYPSLITRVINLSC